MTPWLYEHRADPEVCRSCRVGHRAARVAGAQGNDHPIPDASAGGVLVGVGARRRRGPTRSPASSTTPSRTPTPPPQTSSNDSGRRWPPSWWPAATAPCTPGRRARAERGLSRPPRRSGDADGRTAGVGRRQAPQRPLHVRDYREVGDEVWARFNEGVDSQLWNYGCLVEIFQRRLPGPLTDELVRTVDTLRAEVASAAV